MKKLYFKEKENNWHVFFDWDLKNDLKFPFIFILYNRKFWRKDFRTKKLTRMKLPYGNYRRRYPDMDFIRVKCSKNRQILNTNSYLEFDREETRWCGGIRRKYNRIKKRRR